MHDNANENDQASAKSVQLKPLPRDSWIGINIDHLRPILIDEIRKIVNEERQECSHCQKCPTCNPSSEKERLSNNVTNKDVTANQVAQAEASAKSNAVNAVSSEDEKVESSESKAKTIQTVERVSSSASLATENRGVTKLAFLDFLAAKGGRRRASYGDCQDITVEEEQETSPDEERRWVAVSENAYGAFIHVAIQRGVLTGILKCGPMLVASVVLQMIFALELFYALPSISSRKTEICPTQDSCYQIMCRIPSSLQIAAISIFIILMLNNVPGMFRHAQICLFTSFQRGINANDKNVRIPVTHDLRLVIFIIGVLSELATWMCIVISGINFILTATTVDLVIRSTVAIMFVQNVDEVVFDACCPSEMSQNIASTRYRIVWMTLIPFVPSQKSERVEYFYGLFFHLPFVILTSTTLVLVVRNVPPACVHSLP